MPEEQAVGWGSSAWNRGLPHASSLVWRMPKFRRVSTDPYLLQSPWWGRRQFSTRHVAELWIPSHRERALRLDAGSGRLSERRGSSQESAGCLGPVCLGHQTVTLPCATVCRYVQHALTLALFFPGNLLLAAILG